MDEIARLLAYEEIRQLAARYAVAIDRRDMDALIELFIDAVRVGRDSCGHDALRADFEESVGSGQLNLTNELIGRFCLA